jgi:tRNA(fMet)-specific endonuclease VapC
MSLYVLDTDMLTLYQEGHEAVYRHCAEHAPTALAITVINIEEQLTGWYTLLRRPQSHAQLARIYQRMTEVVRFSARLTILSFTEPAIRRYEELLTRKLNVGKMDLRIAAIVLEQGGTVVTRNIRDFKRVPGLPVEDWSA